MLKVRDRGETVFKRILVPIDLSDRNRRTIDVALALARQNQAHVTLCHVIQSVRDIPSPELRRFYRHLEAASTATLARAARRFTAGGVPVSTLVSIGEPAREIVRLAAGRRIDLIVMGSHKVRAGRTAAGWGRSATRSASSVDARSCW